MVNLNPSRVGVIEVYDEDGYMVDTEALEVYEANTPEDLAALLGIYLDGDGNPAE